MWLHLSYAAHEHKRIKSFQMDFMLHDNTIMNTHKRTTIFYLQQAAKAMGEYFLPYLFYF